MKSDGVRCPDCGATMNMVLAHGECVWFCPKAIGEQAYDRATQMHYVPQPSSHRRVKEWRASDEAIASQLAELVTYIRVRRGEERERRAS